MANSVQFRTTANQFGSRDIEVIPTGRQFGNIGQNTAAGNADYGLTMAGAAVAAIPMIMLFLGLQRFFLKGLTIGAVKG